MDRFEEVQEGDAVYSRIVGDGIVIKVFTEDMYKMRVRFDSGHADIFTVEGKASPPHVEPTLFYRKGEERYLEKRPELEIDWSKVPIGTKTKVNDEKELENKRIQIFMGYFPELERPFWVFDDNDRDTATGFKYCKLAEPCKPEWVKR